MELGGGGAVMLPLFRERGRHARTPLGLSRSTYHRSPRNWRPLAADPLSTPRNVNSRRFNSYEYFPRAWGRSRSGGKDAGEDEEAEEGEEEAEEETEGRTEWRKSEGAPQDTRRPFSTCQRQLIRSHCFRIVSCSSFREF